MSHDIPKLFPSYWLEALFFISLQAGKFQSHETLVHEAFHLIMTIQNSYLVVATVICLDYSVKIEFDHIQPSEVVQRFNVISVPNEKKSKTNDDRL